jgi:hypothetical protein
MKSQTDAEAFYAIMPKKTAGDEEPKALPVTICNERDTTGEQRLACIWDRPDQPQSPHASSGRLPRPKLSPNLVGRMSLR